MPVSLSVPLSSSVPLSVPLSSAVVVSLAGAGAVAGAGASRKGASSSLSVECGSSAGVRRRSLKVSLAGARSSLSAAESLLVFTPFFGVKILFIHVFMPGVPVTPGSG